MKFTKEEIKHQEEFVQAISYQHEAAYEAYHDAEQYLLRIDAHHEEQKSKLEQMKKENN